MSAKGKQPNTQTHFLENHLLAVFFPDHICLLIFITHSAKGGSLGSHHWKPLPKQLAIAKSVEYI